MKIFVTGGTGFIGMHFIEAALTVGHQITALYRSSSKKYLLKNKKLDWIDSEMDKVTTAQLSGHDAFVHLAAAGVNIELATWEACFDVNVVKSIQIWDEAVRAGISKFIIAGSCFEYGKSALSYKNVPTSSSLKPTGAYHASKAAASMAAIALCAEKNLQVAILRPFHVFGEGESDQRFWPSLRRAALSGDDFKMTKGEQVRDFINVEDAAKIFLRFVDMKLINGDAHIENVGTGISMTLKDFAEYWWNKFGGTGKIILGAVPYRDNEIMHYVPEIISNTR